MLGEQIDVFLLGRRNTDYEAWTLKKLHTVLFLQVYT
jgi:hypothetical protein